MSRLLQHVAVALAAAIVAAPAAAPTNTAPTPTFAAAYKELTRRLSATAGSWENLKLQLHAEDQVCTANKQMEKDRQLRPHMPLLWKQFTSTVDGSTRPSAAKVAGYVESAKAQVVFIKSTIAKQFAGGDAKILGLLTRGANKIDRGLAFETAALKEVDLGIARWLSAGHDCAGAVRHFQNGNKLAAERNKAVNDGIEDLRLFSDELEQLVK